jgi:formate dehydrogenase iron-sulfur subunit
VAVGLEPACVGQALTQALSFGSKEDMLFQAEHRLEDLLERGRAKAAIYDPKGVGGTHVVYVLPHGDQPEAYGLPANPRIGPAQRLWRSGLARATGVATMAAVLIAGVLHYMRHGPLEVPPEGGKEGEVKP